MSTSWISYDLSKRVEEGYKNWESMARALRGGLRMLRSEMDLNIESTEGNPHSVDWREEYKSIRDVIDSLLKTIV